MRAREHAGDEITDERRQFESVGDGAEDECQHKAHDDGRNQRRVVWHYRLLDTGNPMLSMTYLAYVDQYG
jgi:hypothetical protein